MTADAGFGVVPLDQARTMDGLTLFRGLLEGRFPAPPRCLRSVSIKSAARPRNWA